jgi:hypothetical protein
MYPNKNIFLDVLYANLWIYPPPHLLVGSSSGAIAHKTIKEKIYLYFFAAAFRRRPRSAQATPRLKPRPLRGPLGRHRFLCASYSALETSGCEAPRIKYLYFKFFIPLFPLKIFLSPLFPP